MWKVSHFSCELRTSARSEKTATFLTVARVSNAIVLAEQSFAQFLPYEVISHHFILSYVTEWLATGEMDWTISIHNEGTANNGSQQLPKLLIGFYHAVQVCCTVPFTMTIPSSLLRTVRSYRYYYVPFVLSTHLKYWSLVHSWVGRPWKTNFVSVLTWNIGHLRAALKNVKGFTF